MKKLAMLVAVVFGCAPVVLSYPFFPPYDAFTDAAAKGGSSYAVGARLAGQTNTMGQYWYGIYTNGSAANALKVTGTTLSYNNLSGFSGQAVMLTNSAGPGARMFFQASSPFSVGSSYYYSVVLVASNINTLSTTGQRIMGFGTQATVGDQSGQPSQGSSLWMRQVGTSPDLGFQLGLTGSGNPGTPTFDVNNTYSVNQVYLLVAAIESGGITKLWINPAPATFGAATEPQETYTGPTGTLAMTAFSCFQMFQIDNAVNNLYVSVARVGTNWAWVTGGPLIGQQPIASTNATGGGLTLNVLAMNNGTPNTYRWQFNGLNLTDGPSVSGSGAIVSGSASDTLTISGMTAADAGSYTVVVANGYGAVTSRPSAVTTFASPSVAIQPGTNMHLFAGVSSSISAVALGYPPLSYYWYSNSVLVPGVSGSVFPMTNVQNNAAIYCVVSNSYGTTTSPVVSLTIIPRPEAPYVTTVCGDRPVGLWALYEGPDNYSGNNGTPAYDYAGGNNGYFTNVVLAQPGYGVGLSTQYGYYPPSDDSTAAGFGQYPSSFSLNSYVGAIPNINFGGASGSPFSVEAWANGLGTVGYVGESIVNKGPAGGEQFTLDYTTGWRFCVRTAVGSQVSALSTNHIDSNWHHLVGVVDTVRSNITLYVDGVAQGAAALDPSAGLLSSSDPVMIGSRKSTSTSTDFDDNFYGSIQNVAVYNYALSGTQIANHYYASGITPAVSVAPSASINEGATLVVPATVTGSPILGYQWYDVTFGSPGTPLAGQTSATLTIANIQASAFNNHAVALTVTNIYGQATGGQVTLSVYSGLPVVTMIPTSAACYVGIQVVFTVTATGTQPFSYQWTTNGVAVPGATNASYTNISGAAGAYTVACQVRNSYGPAPLASGSLKVVDLPTDYYATTVLAAHPMAFWRLDEPTGAATAYDYVGGHHATYSNAINAQPGFSSIFPLETSTEFGDGGINPSMAQENGSDVTGVPLIDFSTQGANGEFSVEFWMNEVPQGNKALLTKGYPNNTQFALDTGGSGNTFRFVVHNSSRTLITAAGGLPDGNWHHIVGVCDQTNGVIRLYVDAKQQGTGSITRNTGILPTTSIYPVIICSQQAQGGTSYSGPTNTCMSQVAIYDYALSASQITKNFNAASAIAPTISAALSGTNLVITYTGVLVSSDDLNSPVTNVVAGATSPYAVPATNQQIFFRAKGIP